jgi:hypothetical protein
VVAAAGGRRRPADEPRCHRERERLSQPPTAGSRVARTEPLTETEPANAEVCPRRARSRGQRSGPSRSAESLPGEWTTRDAWARRTDRERQTARRRRRQRADSLQSRRDTPTPQRKLDTAISNRYREPESTAATRLDRTAPEIVTIFNVRICVDGPGRSSRYRRRWTTIRDRRRHSGLRPRQSRHTGRHLPHSGRAARLQVTSRWYRWSSPRTSGRCVQSTWTLAATRSAEHGKAPSTTPPESWTSSRPTGSHSRTCSRTATTPGDAPVRPARLVGEPVEGGSSRAPALRVRCRRAPVRSRGSRTSRSGRAASPGRP